MLLKEVEIAEGENHQRRPGLEEGRVEKKWNGGGGKAAGVCGGGGKGNACLSKYPIGILEQD